MLRISAGPRGGVLEQAFERPAPPWTRSVYVWTERGPDVPGLEAAPPRLASVLGHGPGAPRCRAEQLVEDRLIMIYGGAAVQSWTERLRAPVGLDLDRVGGRLRRRSLRSRTTS